MAVPEFIIRNENDKYKIKVDFDKGEWLDTSQEHIITVGDYDYFGTAFNVTIKTHKCN